MADLWRLFEILFVLYEMKPFYSFNTTYISVTVILVWLPEKIKTFVTEKQLNCSKVLVNHPATIVSLVNVLFGIRH